ncbi:fibrinogen-like protein A [Hydractinia symbiolongicarpus]|uniref:fibrinogen-like protein A n=1 Tax=Hydractinia symbiolongicarpus TaxID=13093 RepID=UPI0025510561|nr:fibrinogen-like protein A [Hydractinia symbiolongicarpus]
MVNWRHLLFKMHALKELLLVLLKLSLFAENVAQDCPQMGHFKRAANVRLNTTSTNVIRTVTETAVEDCLGSCFVDNGNCKSIVGVEVSPNVVHCQLLRINAFELPAYIEQAVNIHTFFQVPCDNPSPSIFGLLIANARDCKDVYDAGFTNDGIYQVIINNKRVHVLCDMNYLGGGWTVILKRFDGSLNFKRNWDAFKFGFGNLTSEFWFGNLPIQDLTEQQENEIVFILKTFASEEPYYAFYDKFHLQGVNFTLKVGSYVAHFGQLQAGDSLYYHNNTQFATHDRDNDHFCASFYGAWWMDYCFMATFFGEYANETCHADGYCMHWNTLIDINLSLKSATAMIRKKQL